MAHRADPRSTPPSPHRRDRRQSPPDAGPSLLFEPPDARPRDLTPRRAQVTIRYPPPRPPRQWHSPVHWYDVVLIAVIVLAIVALWHFR